VGKRREGHNIHGRKIYNLNGGEGLLGAIGGAGGNQSTMKESCWIDPEKKYIFRYFQKHPKKKLHHVLDFGKMTDTSKCFQTGKPGQ